MSSRTVTRSYSVRGDAPKSGCNGPRCATSIFSPRLPLDVDEITATTGPITPITEARSEERVEAWKNYFIPLEKGFCDMAVSLPYKAPRRHCRLSIAFDNLMICDTGSKLLTTDNRTTDRKQRA